LLYPISIAVLLDECDLRDLIRPSELFRLRWRSLYLHIHQTYTHPDECVFSTRSKDSESLHSTQIGWILLSPCLVLVQM